MDAIEFVKQLRRMDETGVLKKRFIYLREGEEMDSPEDVVAEVEEWAKKHPLKTRQSEFLKHYPTARIDENGWLDVYPCVLCDTYRNKHGGCANDDVGCSECRKDFWSQEVK